MAKSGDDRTYTIMIEFADSPQNGAATGGENAVPTPNEAVPQEYSTGDKQQATNVVKSDKNAAVAMVKQMAGKAANTALNNYGNMTGDYVAQQNIQSVVSEATAIGAAVSLGPTGIAIYTVDKLLQVYNYVGQIKRSERDAEFKQQRVYADGNRS